MKTKKLDKKKIILPDGRYLVYYGWKKEKKFKSSKNSK